ncbi:DUF3310 domain-containing protein [Tetragenococcus halophilus]|uniref:DUF3310 domain-containing protein n=1 Tax=Tetragenococcus halophilus TaxID=51669 RepID=A0A3G5FKF3_TETHA|nr:DUF3310 domain-containing protein [Tetragenococcus halophilus]AYW50810.1 DUF3310 domain-containing protein [Tetragenococcus halophilus]GBD64893.1 putative uncharacterized protein [Tetragenococcus halophilus subsp. flandriensis]GMA08917.1 hypothetical protein GCM10025886_20680 [Tetragenococcus halophilus subsp. flandriensis]
MNAFVTFLLILLGFIIGGLFVSWVFKDDDDTTVRSEEYYEQLDENTRLLRRNVELRNQISKYKEEERKRLKNGEYLLSRDETCRLMSDNVNHPNHYTQGDIETIDYIKDKLTDEEFRGFVKGNVLKYVSREGLKNGDEDLKKSDWYLNKLIEVLEQ